MRIYGVNKSVSVFDTPDLFERMGIVLITPWIWSQKEQQSLGALFSRFVPLETDFSDLMNGGIRIRGVSPDLPLSDPEKLQIYTARS